MAKVQSISLDIASDYLLRFTIYDKTETSIVDVTGMALSWMLKKSLGQPDAAALLTKISGSGVTVSGVFNANPLLNTQKVSVVVRATDTIALSPRADAHELKRMDIGFETVLTKGTATLVRVVHRT